MAALWAAGPSLAPLPRASAVFMDVTQLERHRSFFRQKYPGQARKILQLLGVTETQVLREKAVRRLGTCETTLQVRRRPRCALLPRVYVCMTVCGSGWRQAASSNRGSAYAVGAPQSHDGRPR